MRYRRFIPSHDLADGGVGLSASLELIDDATGQPVRLDEVIDAFNGLSATGIHVKRKGPEAPFDRGVIVGYSDWKVFVNDADAPDPEIAGIPREAFHQLFALD